jgi:DNA-binding MarR family transcriptional regulator
VKSTIKSNDLFFFFGDSVLQIKDLTENELAIIVAIAFNDDFATLPDLSVALLLKPSVVQKIVDGLINKKVLKKSTKGGVVVGYEVCEK